MVHRMHMAGLETFLAILDEGSMIGAARQLHVSQSTVTARLQTLEREIGHQLISRSKAGATATAAGQRVRRNIETMLDLWTQAQRDISQPDTVLDVCTIGCSPDLWAGCVDGLVRLASSEQHRLALSVRQGSATDIAMWQRTGLVDLAIAHALSVPIGQSSWQLATDELVLVATDPTAPVHFDPGYVLIEAGADFARWHAATYANAAIARLTFDSPVLGLEHLRAQGGSAYLPHRMVQPFVQAGELHRLANAPSFTREVHMIGPADATERWSWFGEALALLS